MIVNIFEVTKQPHSTGIVGSSLEGSGRLGEA
jgi:hypothetical protein